MNIILQWNVYKLFEFWQRYVKKNNYIGLKIIEYVTLYLKKNLQKGTYYICIHVKRYVTYSKIRCL